MAQCATCVDVLPGGDGAGYCNPVFVRASTVSITARIGFNFREIATAAGGVGSFLGGLSAITRDLPDGAALLPTLAGTMGALALFQSQNGALRQSEDDMAALGQVLASEIRGHHLLDVILQSGHDFMAKRPFQ